LRLCLHATALGADGGLLGFVWQSLKRFKRLQLVDEGPGIETGKVRTHGKFLGWRVAYKALRSKDVGFREMLPTSICGTVHCCGRTNIFIRC